jgi:hypothetical protein
MAVEYKYQYQYNFENEWHWTPAPQPGTGNVYTYGPVYAQRLVYAPVITREDNERLAQAIRDGVVAIYTGVDELISWIGYQTGRILGLN